MVVMKKILDGFVKAVSVILMGLISGIVLLMLNELFLRNILGKSFRGMTELAGFMFLWMAFLGVIVLYDQNRLISLDMFYVRTKGTLREVLWFIHRLIALSLGVIMIIAFAGLYPYVSTEFFSSMPTFAKAWQYLPMAVAGGYLTCKSIYVMVERILLLRSKNVKVGEDLK